MLVVVEGHIAQQGWLHVLAATELVCLERIRQGPLNLPRKPLVLGVLDLVSRCSVPNS